MEENNMKSLIITGTLITKDTAAGYIERMCAYCFGDAFDMAACTMLVDHCPDLGLLVEY